MVSIAISIQKKPDLVKDLGRKLPEAVRGTLNDLGFMLRKIMINEIENKFTTRNAYTKKGITVAKVPKGMRDIMKMSVLVGADQKRAYLAAHHEGSVTQGRSPTNKARMNSSYRKLVRKNAYISRNGVKDLRSFRSTAKTQKGKYYAMAAMAWRRREKSLLNITQDAGTFPPGLYRFTQAARSSVGSRGFPRLTRLYKKGSGKKIPARKWLERANSRIKQSTLDGIFAKNAARILSPP